MNNDSDKDASDDKSELAGRIPDAAPSDENASQPEDISGKIGGGMLVLLWILVLAGGTWLAQGWLDGRVSRHSTIVYSDGSSGPSLELSANRYGQYWIGGSANGQAVDFLLDTGASTVSLPQAVASRLELKRGKASRAFTANGSVTVYATRLAELRIGPFIQTNVRAHINPHMQGDVALLGMSYLQHFEMQQRNGSLTISKP